MNSKLRWWFSQNFSCGWKTLLSNIHPNVSGGRVLCLFHVYVFISDARYFYSIFPPPPADISPTLLEVTRMHLYKNGCRLIILVFETNVLYVYVRPRTFFFTRIFSTHEFVHGSIHLFIQKVCTYREYPTKCHERKRHISTSRNDNPILKKVPERTFKPILWDTK